MVQGLAVAGIAFGAMCLPARAEKAPMPQRPVLVELFTSQGCSSCPKANVVLGRLAREPNVIALTYAVGYWDYLGWRDTFAKPEFTKRQKHYSKAFGRGLYTPQMVVDGAGHSSGLKSKELRELIGAVSMLGGVKLEAAASGGKANISLGGPAPALPSEVWLVQFTPGPVTVEVKRGENAGAAVTHHNVVTQLTRIGDWAGGSQKFESPCALACVVVVQEKVSGRVLAAQGVGASGS